MPSRLERHPEPAVLCPRLPGVCIALLAGVVLTTVLLTLKEVSKIQVQSISLPTLQRGSETVLLRNQPSAPNASQVHDSKTKTARGKKVIKDGQANNTRMTAARQQIASDTEIKQVWISEVQTRIGPPFKLQSEMAKKIQLHQSNQSLPIANTTMDHRAGLGSCIHVWSQKLCHAIHTGARLSTIGDWEPWADHTHCNTNANLQCYFKIEQVQGFFTKEIGIGDKTTLPCPSIIYDYPSQERFRAAATEYLFAGGLPQFLMKEVKYQMQRIFGKHDVPSKLITVHIRWGDKIYLEMLRVDTHMYVNAVTNIVMKRNVSSDVNVYIATEDPAACKAFKAACPAIWNVYCDYGVTEQVGIRPTGRTNHALDTADASKGLLGTQNLASLVIAMEANDFVLTTSSNWSRLMDELRRNVIDPLCNNCTTVIDFNIGEQQKRHW